MKAQRLSIVALVSVTVIGLELTWTRIFSAEFFYTFAFLVLSLAVLGIGMGALALHLWPGLGRGPRLVIPLLLCGATALAAPPLAFKLGLDFSLIYHTPAMIGKLIAGVLLLNLPHFFAGVALAAIFREHHDDMPRLYMADLVGAAAGVVFAILAMDAWQTPAATFFCAAPVLLAALLVSCRWYWRLLPLVPAAAMVWLAPQGLDLLERQREERAPVLGKHWDSVSKIKILDYGEDFRGFNIDNAAHSTLYRFDGNWDRPDSLRFEFGIDVSYLMDQFDECTFLSLGAGGGADALQALQGGCAEVHAVEVIGHINEMMKTGEFAEFTGNIYSDPRVVVATEDARAYVRRYPGKFDLIYSLSSNTFAALASGAFALAENYLFTTEAYRDYWNALSDGGYMMMEHQFFMPRLVSELRDALEAEGVDQPTDHFAIYNLPSMRRNKILLSKKPLTDEIRNNAFAPLSPELHEHIHLLYPAADSLQDNLINQIVLNGWEAEQDSADFDLSPATDNRPFTAQLGLWKNFSFDKLERVSPFAEVMGFPLSKLLIVTILGVVVVLILPLNLLPAIKRTDRLRPIPWLYFFAIGAAFMMVEVILILQFTLLVGPSIYGVATILLTLLLMSGIGSRLSTRISAGVSFAAILIWLVLDMLLFESMVAGLGHLALPGRIVTTGLAVAPLGLFMGMPFPKAALRVGPAVPWGLAVNGTASVLGSTAIVLFAFAYGFRVSLILAGGVYLIAAMLYSARSSWRR